MISNFLACFQSIMKRSASPVPNGLPALKRARSSSPVKACPEAAEPSDPAPLEAPTVIHPPESRDQYWGPVIDELKVRYRPQLTEMGGLYIVDVHLSIPRDKRLPPAFAPTKQEVSSFQEEFGKDALAELDNLYANEPLMLVDRLS